MSVVRFEVTRAHFLRWERAWDVVDLQEMTHSKSLASQKGYALKGCESRIAVVLRLATRVAGEMSETALFLLK